LHLADAYWIDGGDDVCFVNGLEDDELDGRGSYAAAWTVLSGVHDELHFELCDAGWRHGWVYVRGQFRWCEFERERYRGWDVAGDGDLSGGYLRDDECADLGD